MSFGESVLFSVLGILSLGAFGWFSVWAVRKLGRMRQHWNDFWDDIGKLFAGNNRG